MPPLAADTDASDLPLSRRTVVGLLMIIGATAFSGAQIAIPPQSPRRARMSVTCFIRYQIDPFQRDAFEEYARQWGRIIPECGGHLVGYFLPHEGTNDIAWGLIAFESLASYEAYRARLKAHPRGRENFAMAASKRFILREERTFLQIVDGTFGIEPAK